MRECRTLLVLLFVLLPSPVASDVVVTRTIDADEFVFASRVGANRACPERVSRPKTGDQVTLSVAPEMARRDEPDLSVIVNFEGQKAYIVHHQASTYSELDLPIESNRLETDFRASMGAAAGRLFPFRARGELRWETVTLGGRKVSRRTVVVSSTILRRRSVAIDVLPREDLGAPAFEVESLAQAFRMAGEEWLSSLGSPDGIPLGFTESIRQPSSTVVYREVFTDLETVSVDAAIYAPPADYSRVDHDPQCFYAPY